MTTKADALVVTIPLERNHPLVRMTDELNWDELTEIIQVIRRKKLKNAAGRPPKLRATIGSAVLMATRKVSYREAQDLIRYYAPARYMCGLEASTWTPDHSTIHNFALLGGAEGMQAINEYLVKLAEQEGLADPSIAAADTTAQEAAIPYPNEMGLMSSYLLSLGKAAKKAAGAVGALFTGAAARLAEKARKTLREHRLFAKDKAEKSRLTTAMADIVEAIQTRLGAAIAKDRKAAETGRGLDAPGPPEKAVALHGVMTKLLAQIRYWLKTGKVAKDKIISVHIPELYSIVRGKVGKSVEFGLSWGITRLGGGYILAAAGTERRSMTDSSYVIAAVDRLRLLFGKVPKAYAYDRGGDGTDQVSKLKKRGIKKIGVAPRGKRPWLVSGKTKEKLVRFRAMVEGAIGALKRSKYDFNRPNVRSVRTTAMAGHRAVLGFNLNKFFRERKRRSRLHLGRKREPPKIKRTSARRAAPSKNEKAPAKRTGPPKRRKRATATKRGRTHRILR